MWTIEDQYPVADLNSVAQYLRREIARSQACCAHQSVRNPDLANDLGKWGDTLKTILGHVEQDISYQNRAASEYIYERGGA